MLTSKLMKIGRELYIRSITNSDDKEKLELICDDICEAQFGIVFLEQLPQFKKIKVGVSEYKIKLDNNFYILLGAANQALERGNLLDALEYYSLIDVLETKYVKRQFNKYEQKYNKRINPEIIKEFSHNSTEN